MKRFLFSLQLALMAAVVMASPSQAVAQSDMDLQPGIVISIANLDEQLSDIEHLVEAAGMGQMAGLVRMGASEYIRGIDPEKPMGAYLFFDEENPEEPSVIGFVPVTDIEDVLDTLADFVDIDEDDDNFILTTNDGEELIVQEKDGYAFIVQDEELLKNVPGDPTALLEDLPSQYNFSARVFGQRVPESLRNQAIELIREGAESEMSNLGDGPEAELQKANFEFTMEMVEGFINDTEEVVIGMSIDEDKKRIYGDVRLVGTPMSRFAKQSNALADSPDSRFGGFVMDNSALSGLFCGKMDEEDLKYANEMLDKIKELAVEEMKNEFSGDQYEAVQGIFNDIISVAEGGLAKGYFDGGASVVMNEDSIELVAGVTIAEGSKLEDSVKGLAKLAKESGEDIPVSFDFDVAKEDGIRYHKVTVSVPDGEEEARKMFGESLEILLGVGDDVLYIASSSDPMATIKKCISNSKAGLGDGVVGQVDMHLIPLMRFGAKFQDDENMQSIVDLLPESADDRMRMTMSAFENGQQFRFEMQDAMLEIFTQVGQSMGGGFGGPPQDF